MRLLSGLMVTWVPNNHEHPSVYLMEKEPVEPCFWLPQCRATPRHGQMIHNAPHTSSSIVSKSIAKGGGKVDYRGQVTFNKNSRNLLSHRVRDTIIMDDLSASDTIPFNEIHNCVKLWSTKLRFLRFQRNQLTTHEPWFVRIWGNWDDCHEICRTLHKKELPMEYAVELNRLD